MARERGNAITMAGALDNLGNRAINSGNLSQARAWLEESLELQLPLGAPGFVGTLGYLIKLGIYDGDFVAARAYGDEVHSMSKNAGMTMSWTYLWSFANLGYIALREGNMAQAKEMFSLAIQQFQKAGSLIGIVFAIEGLASLHVHQERFARATQLLGWAGAMREKISDQRPPVEQASVEKDLAVIHSKVDDAECTRLSAEGRDLTIEQAIALALEE